ncbi:hypothetical protein BLNAU_10967 [Blattamonas nauphoetae]|uniref:Uncharacterized protein n=1 Tax=Blattamonas nauphoetae TaxID=2049346 RepID=A0ABQ9XRX4_9EUKA|nr:hypothetical protein BLNAU_10967 [Blattamonas nauphoetae]
MTASDTTIITFTDSFCPDCSSFMNWDEGPFETERKKAVIFQSLIATVKLQTAFDDSFEAKAVSFLESVDPDDEESADAFLNSFGQTTDESLTNFIQSIVVLISSASQVIITATMELLAGLIVNCSSNIRLTLVKANLIPQLIRTFNPQSRSFAEIEDTRSGLIDVIAWSFSLSTPDGLAQPGFQGHNEQQAIHETVLKQILVPSESYICHLCVNRYSIIDGDLSTEFMRLLAYLLRICPYYQPTMDFVLHMPVFLTIPSCLTFIENSYSIGTFLLSIIGAQWIWNEKMGEERQMWKSVDRKLRMEGIEDVVEQKLQNNKDEIFGGRVAVNSIRWNNLQGMNLPE